MKELVRMKITYITLIGLFVFGLNAISCSKDDEPTEKKEEEFTLEKYAPEEVSKTNTTKVYMHFMPWFETKETSDNGNWGIHWTMATKNPDNINSNGKREIASHFYPLTGPYASGDPVILEYQLLLMKYAGIDGIFIDWYGSSDINDYALIQKNTQTLIDQLDEVGMNFAIVYEDRTISEAVSKNASFDRIAGAQNDMIFLKQNYFKNNHYIKIDGQPLLLNFGPIEFHNESEWTQIMSVFSTPPIFLVLNGKSAEAGNTSSGEYIWVDQTSLDSKYASMDQFDYFIGGAYSGFKDFYGLGGWGESFSLEIDHQDGKTLRDNLAKAKTAHVNMVQLITWNDYGEGTMIEPTEELGFKPLNEVQNFTGTTYNQPELESIFNLYQARIKYKDNSEIQLMLDQVFYDFVSLKVDDAKALLESINKQ